jgi:hypothetical protein
MHTARDTGRARALPTTPDTSRRRLFATAASALVAGAALATAAHGAPVTDPSGDDAELIRLHQELVAQTAVVQAWNDDLMSEPAGEAANDRWWEIVNAMWPIKPVTLVGVVAKAAAARLVLEFTAYSSGTSDDFAWDTLEQIAAWGGAA